MAGGAVGVTVTVLTIPVVVIKEVTGVGVHEELLGVNTVERVDELLDGGVDVELEVDVDVELGGEVDVELDMEFGEDVGVGLGWSVVDD